MVGGENNSIRQPVLGTPLDRGGWFLREHNIEVVTRVNKVNAVSCIILWVSFVINNSGTEISVISIVKIVRVHIDPYHVCKHKHFYYSAPCSLPVHAGVCNVLL